MLFCVCDGRIAVGFAVRLKEGFMGMLNRNFARLVPRMMGVFSRVCSVCVCVCVFVCVTVCHGPPTHGDSWYKYRGTSGDIPSRGD